MSTVPRLVGLSVHQPWAWCLAQGYKPVENRTWHPPAAALGRYVAIQASKAFDAKKIVTQLHELVRQQLIRADVVPTLDDLKAQCGHVIGVGCLDRYVRESSDPIYDDPWFVGPIGWVFTGMLPIQAIPCRGQQGLFQLDPATLAAVREAYGRARLALRP